MTIAGAQGTTVTTVTAPCTNAPAKKRGLFARVTTVGAASSSTASATTTAAATAVNANKVTATTTKTAAGQVCSSKGVPQGILFACDVIKAACIAFVKPKTGSPVSSFPLRVLIQLALWI